MTLEGGKPLVENTDEVGWVAAAFDYYAEMGRNFAGRVIPPIESTQLALVMKEPMGVVGCIVPWNYPLLLLAWKVAPALAAGNTVVAKPSELTPLSTLALASCFDHLPPGAVNLLAGAGDVGEAIVADERIDCVAFTGSVATGKKIAMKCAERVARVNLELGGKDPFIVCPDVADAIDVAAQGRRVGRLPERGPGVHVGRALLRARAGLRRLRARVRRLHGVARDRRPARPAHRHRADGVGRCSGARSPTRSRARSRPARSSSPAARTRAGTERGHFFAPAVVTGAPARDRPAARGDVRAGRADRAGALARRGDRARQRDALRPRRNVYTRDLETIFRCMREIKAGTVWFNDPLTDNDAGPFGGFKQSGLGRELGQEGLEAFQETKHVHIESAGRGEGVVVPVRRVTGGS